MSEQGMGGTWTPYFCVARMIFVVIDKSITTNLALTIHPNKIHAILLHSNIILAMAISGF